MRSNLSRWYIDSEQRDYRSIQTRNHRAFNMSIMRKYSRSSRSSSPSKPFGLTANLVAGCGGNGSIIHAVALQNGPRPDQFQGEGFRHAIEETVELVERSQADFLMAS